MSPGGDGDNTATAAVEGDVQQPKAPVIIEQPPRKIVSVIGEDLMLVLKVIGEHPIRFVLNSLIGTTIIIVTVSWVIL